MLGYTAEDLYRMMAGISIARAYVPLNTSNEEIIQELSNAYNLLDGLLSEGHVM